MRGCRPRGKLLRLGLRFASPAPREANSDGKPSEPFGDNKKPTRLGGLVAFFYAISASKQKNTTSVMDWDKISPPILLFPLFPLLSFLVYVITEWYSDKN